MSINIQREGEKIGRELLANCCEDGVILCQTIQKKTSNTISNNVILRKTRYWINASDRFN